MLFLHHRQGTSEFPVYAFQEGQYGFRRANTNSGGPIQIHQGQYETVYGFEEGQYETVYGFEEGHFRRANTETYQKQNVNLSTRVRKDRVFLGLAGLLLRISLRLCPREIPRSSSASPQTTPSFSPLLLRLTQYKADLYRVRVARSGTGSCPSCGSLGLPATCQQLPNAAS